MLDTDVASQLLAFHEHGVYRICARSSRAWAGGCAALLAPAVGWRHKALGCGFESAAEGEAANASEQLQAAGYFKLNRTLNIGYRRNHCTWTTPVLFSIPHHRLCILTTTVRSMPSYPEETPYRTFVRSDPVFRYQRVESGPTIGWPGLANDDLLCVISSAERGDGRGSVVLVFSSWTTNYSGIL